MSFTGDLLEMPPSLSRASKYTVMTGLLYFGAGALFIVWPGAVQTLLMDQPFAGHEGALFRTLRSQWVPGYSSSARRECTMQMRELASFREQSRAAFGEAVQSPEWPVLGRERFFNPPLCARL
jgi:hypothetical protein